MATSAVVVVPLLRIALFIGCRLTLLPWLFGEAKHASLDTEGADVLPSGPGSASTSTDQLPLSSLPSPATASTSRSGGFSGLKDRVASSAASTAALRQQPQGMVHAIIATVSPSALLLALGFEEGTILFALVLMEGMGFDHSFLASQWHGSLFGVVSLAVCLIPLGLSILITYTLFPQSNFGATALTRRLAVSLVPFFLWIIAFIKVPLPATIASSPTTTLLESALARTAVVGVTLIAVLSGSGAMGAAVDSYEAIAASRSGYRRDPTPNDVKNAEGSFRKACEDLARTKREIERVQSAVEPEQEGGLFAGLGRAFRGSPRDRELKSLNLELSSLNMLASSMRDELDDLKARRKEADWNATLGGRFWLVVGHAFAAYCVLRLAVSLLSLIFLNYSTASSSSSPDVISTLLARLLHFFTLDVDVAAWSKQISLLFVGFLILGRLRVVLNYLARFFRAASSGISTSFLILFLSEIMVIYLLATLIQLRASLPSSYGGGGGGETDPSTPPPTIPAPTDGGSSSSAPADGQPQPLLASLPDFNIVFGALFDAAFLLSAAATLGIRRLTAQTEGILFNSGGRAA